MEAIDTDIKLDFSDVLIVPKTSTLESRSEVTVDRTFILKHAGWEWTGVPIIGANMDTTGTMEMARALNDFGALTALHKHYDVEELMEFFVGNGWEDESAFYSLGTSHADFAKLQDFIIKYRTPRMICMDVANGYTMQFLERVSMLRDMCPDSFIMAGNVVTAEKTEQVILAGADCAKIGIGPGCLAEDSRILMSNGRYKDIKDVQIGDRIINMNGIPASVKKSFSTGVRKVITVKNNSFNRGLTLTSDHKCFVGDLSTTSYSTIQGRGYSTLLQQPTKKKQSKLKWKAISESTDKVTGLMPSKIQWELPENFEYDISDFFIIEKHKDNYNLKIKSNYNLGYMFGFYLGDGNNHIHTHKKIRGNSTSGRVEFNIFKDDKHHITKLTQVITHVTGKEPMERYDNNVCVLTLYSKQWAEFFNEFGKRTEKHLPESYYCLDKNYLTGLYDGLIDSDGNIEKDNITHKFTNTSQQLIELFGFLTYNLYGYFPYYTAGKLHNSDLIEAKNESYNCKHTITGGQIKSRLMEDYQIVKFTNFDNKIIEVPVYDLEIDDETHSFVANNIIVHNSVCTTRKMTGVGYPQLSAILECAAAAHGVDGLVCGDGGCVVPGDIVKAFGAGADFVMLGGMLAGTDETPGDIVNKPDGTGRKYKEFYGMSSKKANDTYAGGLNGYRAAEGKEVLVPYKGPVNDVIQEILGGIRSAMTYTGCRKLKELTKRTKFIRVNNQLNNVFS